MSRTEPTNATLYDIKLQSIKHSLLEKTGLDEPGVVVNSIKKLPDVIIQEFWKESKEYVEYERSESSKEVRKIIVRAKPGMLYVYLNVEFYCYILKVIIYSSWRALSPTPHVFLQIKNIVFVIRFRSTIYSFKHNFLRSLNIFVATKTTPHQFMSCIFSFTYSRNMGRS